MTYLSRLLLDPLHQKVQRDLANCHDLHRTILSAFPDAGRGIDGARAEYGILYRVEAEASCHLPRVLVQSKGAPIWEGLPVGYLACTHDSPANPATRTLDGQFAAIEAGGTLRFRLRANPTKRLLHDVDTAGPRQHGRRVDLRKEEEQIDWLARKGSVAGFDLLYVNTDPGVPDVLTTPGPKQHGWRRLTGSLTFGSVLFEGELRVTNAGIFRETLRNGIGSGKAYGFGLLSVAPAGL